MENVIAIFDIGKTNKKILLFDQSLNVVFQEEQRFDEITDDDGFSCDDILKVEDWMVNSLQKIIEEGQFEVKALNFATYGASLVYLDKDGKRITPVYNYLKPMPEDVLENFYEKFGGVEEFSRNTASPALGMLNSGLQALWLKRKKPETFAKVKQILHFPQYLSYCFTGKVTSEYTSIGCHPAMWNFDNMTYHPWLAHEQIQLPQPISNGTVFPVKIKNRIIPVGIGVHDSSSSLVPYLSGNSEQFILISTGTWCIFMNPFNEEPLTADQLKKDSLCYLSVQQKQVKSSRLFLGHIHEVNAARIAEHFSVNPDFFKQLQPNEAMLKSLIKKNESKPAFFSNGIPEEFIDKTISLSEFISADEAYHQLMLDLTRLSLEALKLVIPKNNSAKAIYISGGFARNTLFVRLLATLLPGNKIYTSEVDNATAIGAALTVWNSAFGSSATATNLGLKEYKPFDLG